MYYKLTYHNSVDKKQVGDFFLCGAQKLDIGQTNCCELRLPESSDFEPVVLQPFCANKKGKDILSSDEQTSMSCRLMGND